MSNDITRNKNSDKYARLFEAAQDGILLLEHPSGLITDANPYICSMLGYSREELIGREMWEIGFVADKALAQVAHDELIKAGYVRYDGISLQKMNGEIFECELICNSYVVGGDLPEQVIQCNIRDISKRRKAERELAEAAVANARLLQQTVPVFPALSNHATHTPPAIKSGWLIWHPPLRTRWGCLTFLLSVFIWLVSSTTSEKFLFR